MQALLRALRAIAEPTRLRLLLLCAHAELTVGEMAQILEQSQPRVSRHLRLMVEAWVLRRHQEGVWARYRIADAFSEPGTSLGVSSDDSAARSRRLAAACLDLIPESEAAADLGRLETVRRERERQAAAYFAHNAAQWNQLRARYVDEAEVNAAVREAFAGHRTRRLLDVGTGTGGVLRALADRVETAVGVDLSLPMLAIARAALDRAHLEHCQARQADLLHLPWGAGAFDAACIHMVLHYVADPLAALRETARVLEPGGLLVVVDFAAHAVPALRLEHAHRWPGFAAATMADWLTAAGFAATPPRRLRGGTLEVCLWAATRTAETARERKDNDGDVGTDAEL